MEKLKKAIEGKDRWNGLISSISLIEENQISNPNISLDGAKSILETISKTILADKNIGFNTDSTLGYLVKLAFSSLPIITKLNSLDVQNTKSLLGSFENIARVIGEFRNTYGFFSHAQDLQSKKFDKYLTNLAISSSDLLTSFLVISHAEDLKDRSRLYYDEHDLFNRYIDEISEELITVANVIISPSRALYTDREAYKEAFLDFENRRIEAIQKFLDSDNVETTHLAFEELEEFSNYLTDEESIQILKLIMSKNQVNMLLNDNEIMQFISDLYEAKKEILEKDLRENIEVFLS